MNRWYKIQLDRNANGIKATIYDENQIKKDEINIMGTGRFDTNIFVSIDNATVGTTTYYDFITTNYTDNYGINSFSIANTDTLDYFKYQCIAIHGTEKTYSGYKDYNNTHAIPTIDKRFQIHFYSQQTGTEVLTFDTNWNGLITQRRIGITNYLLSEFITRTTRNYNYNLSAAETSGLYQDINTTIDINENITDKNYQFTPNQLILRFNNITGVPTTTDGNLFHSGGGYNFTNVNIIIYKSNLPEGIVKILFNQTKQAYEFENTYNQHTDENIQILTQTLDKEIYVYTTDITGAKIENAQIRVSLLNTDTNKWNLIGQYLTDSTGIARIKTDNNMIIKIDALKDEYQPNSIQGKTENWTEVGYTLQITLKSTGYTILNNIAIYTDTGTPIRNPKQVGIYQRTLNTENICYKLYTSTDANTWIEDTTWYKCVYQKIYSTTFTVQTADINKYFKVIAIINTDSNKEFIWQYLPSTSPYTTPIIATQTVTDKDQREQFAIIFIFTIILCGIIEILWKEGQTAFMIITPIFVAFNWLFIPIVIISAIYWTTNILGKGMDIAEE